MMRPWVLLLPVVLLQACAGTPLADQLEQSFAMPDSSLQPESSPAASSPPEPAVAEVDQAPPKDEPVETPDPVPEAKVADRSLEAKSPKPERDIPQQPPAPYRITIRLAGADPAAPAEAVTQALRTSAVEFMVESIERVVP
tara:strand:- start:202 stop:624 length:423 start_codon:yes stop_codon:yes gene_type:complete